jgi:hypothetical protein
MESFEVRDLREHTGALVRNAEGGQYSIVSKHGAKNGGQTPLNPCSNNIANTEHNSYNY